MKIKRHVLRASSRAFSIAADLDQLSERALSDHQGSREKDDPEATARAKVCAEGLSKAAETARKLSRVLRELTES